ncbi:MAG TPA: hypothetical protein VKC56_01795 [Gallionellaceae bacterium]|nr:hypothetical protein [Gallionellaceae bacterium]
MFYWSLKSMPELQRRSATERRQAAWQMGWKPLFVWQVWAALFATGLLMLWGLETLTGNLFISHRITAARVIAWAAGAGGVIYIAHLIYTHVYLTAMRPHIRRVSFDYSEGWLSGMIKGVIMSLLSGCLMAGSMLAIDWVINNYDTGATGKLTALKNWPKRLSAADNGFYTAVGLMAAPGASASEAGERWVAAVNEEAIRRSGKYPEPPHGLHYAAYAAGEDSFCDVGNASCWDVWVQHKPAVESWLAANRELLTRYESLQKYPQWQFAIMTEDEKTPGPAYDALLDGQSLYLAAAVQEMSKGLSGKRPPAKWQVEFFGRGLDMIGQDIDMVRTVLAGTDTLEGKMTAATMLLRDIALLAETAQAYPKDMRPHWDEIARMLPPLSEDQLSVADGFRFEEKIASSRGQARYAALVSRAPRSLRGWLMHHYKKDNTAAILGGYWERVIEEAAVTDAARTPQLAEHAHPVLAKVPRWTGYLHNQGGKYMLMSYRPRYAVYVNRMYDLNAINALMRARAQLSVRHFSAAGALAFLNESASDKNLLNPETGKPFEWDAVRKELYFTPVTDFVKAHDGLDASAEGRVGIRVY